MSKETSVRDASENPVYSMLENAMLVVDEEEAKKFLGATRLLQLMVDSGDGIGRIFVTAMTHLIAITLCDRCIGTRIVARFSKAIPRSPYH